MLWRSGCRYKTRGPPNRLQDPTMLTVYLMFFLLAFTVARDATNSVDSGDTPSVETPDFSPESPDSPESGRGRRAAFSPHQKVMVASRNRAKALI
ncbi:hypothetical protein OSTOST_23857 [Ostertagia ostertagi]